MTIHRPKGPYWLPQISAFLRIRGSNALKDIYPHGYSQFRGLLLNKDGYQAFLSAHVPYSSKPKLVLRETQT